MTFWTIEWVFEGPISYIAATGDRPTYQFKNAKRFESKEAAKAEIARLRLTWHWEAVPHTQFPLSDGARWTISPADED